MNALSNVVCVMQGKVSLKDQSIVAMNSFAATVTLTKPQFADQFDALVEKANSLPDEFFAGIEVPEFECWDAAGRAVAAAVAKA